MADRLPYIPQYITVHLGAPNSDAQNVTVQFQEYIYNVASSEVYPTWEYSALRANILAIISFALNKVYTEFYPSRGYDFDITSSTAYDQKFILGRNYFDTIIEVTDQVIDNYIRRIGNVQPLAASFCNGTTVTCSGLSQWGSQQLAKQGRNSVEILRQYYGQNIELVVGAPVRAPRYSYRGTPFRLGTVDEDVIVIQSSINEIAIHYPLIPVITPVDGVYGPLTEASVRVFQEIFHLTVDGIVGKATWYKLVQLYVALRRLNELDAEGVRYVGISWAYPQELSEGDSGAVVAQLQYMLSIISQYLPEVPELGQTGYFGSQTRRTVAAFQEWAGLSPDGIVGEATWNAIYAKFAGIQNTVLPVGEPYRPLEEGEGT